MFLTYLFYFVPFYNLLILVLIHLIAFGIYGAITSQYNLSTTWKMFKSAWSIFLYMVYLLLYVKISAIHVFKSHNIITAIAGLVLALILFYLMVSQKETHITNFNRDPKNK